ncbi:NgoPII family restriction endonuclease [Candidatus Gracilibacteria bacterium]|nr:NgoPII family restriction endonuclease [Candidatus Gracilibacteria bacterium]NJM87378.1 NgoPII family restriction endonuclease [Hydrococcus sp. RU_2_2]NJP19051.1 NgoPII family restriction endonuclease [Hydrococcus sp. CRU_1_1]
MTNILQAIFTITADRIPDVVSFYRSKNKINAAGDALELFVKDIFANTLSETNENKKAEIYETIFSYFGNANNPPDFIIKNGDAVEVKKLESETASIALNSSYPSAQLFVDSPMIMRTCRECEQWSRKDIIYAIGCVKQQKLSSRWLVDGDCYAASREVYEKIRTKIAAGISEIPEVEFSQTKELGRVNKVDPLGITYLRIRGMWHIEHPQKIYSYLDLNYESNKTFRLFALMRESKYLSFPIEDRKKLERTNALGLQIQNVKIKLPDNPVKRISAKLISYQL